MIKPTIDVYVTNGKVQFRFSRIGLPKFRSYLYIYKAGLPGMQWRKQKNKWELPVEMFKPLYELSRLVFGVQNINLHYPDYRPNSEPVQLSIFDKDS